MNIILQNYQDLLKKITIDTFSNNLKNNLADFDSNDNVLNYVNLVSNLDLSLCEVARKSLVTIIETIDKSYSNSLDRRRKYYIKSHHSRTILTVFGEITFNRTFYQSKLNGKLYCHVDRLLGLHKYDYFDPYLKALAIHYSADNSYPKVAEIINDLIGNRISIVQKVKYLSRQTIRNIIMKSILSNPVPSKKNTPTTLYVIADEKWIHTQNNDKKDVMEKAIVIFEGIDNHKLLDKMTFASLDNSLIDDCLDYIDYVYDISKIKKIYVMGDGASWIKKLKCEFQLSSNIEVIYALDKFHFKQALHHICLDIDLEDILKGYIRHNYKDYFIEACNSLTISFPYREDTIFSKKNYILNNWKAINNIYNYKLSCPMESQISHTLAALFTSRPKAYSIGMINKLTSLRLLFKNGFNIKHLFFNNFNSNNILIAGHEHINYNFSFRKPFLNLSNIIPDYFYSIPFDSSYHSMKFIH